MTQQMYKQSMQLANKIQTKIDDFKRAVDQLYYDSAPFQPGDKVLFKQGNLNQELFVKKLKIKNFEIRYILVHPRKDGTQGEIIFSHYGAPESQLTLIKRRK